MVVTTPQRGSAQSRCGICQVKGDHWARYCPNAVIRATVRIPETVVPVKTLVKTPEQSKTSDTPLETETPAKTQPAKTETQPIKIESQALPSGPIIGDKNPCRHRNTGGGRRPNWTESASGVGLKSGPVNTMVERLTTLWTRQTETPQTDETPPKKTKVGRSPKLPFLNNI